MLRDMETRLPRWAGVFLALLFAISVMVAFALAITLTLTSFEQSIPGYRESAQREWTQLLSWLKAKLNLELPELQALPSRLFSSLAGSILSSSMGIVSDGAPRRRAGRGDARAHVRPHAAPPRLPGRERRARAPAGLGVRQEPRPAAEVRHLAATVLRERRAGDVLHSREWDLMKTVRSEKLGCFDVNRFSPKTHSVG